MTGNLRTSAAERTSSGKARGKGRVVKASVLLPVLLMTILATLPCLAQGAMEPLPGAYDLREFGQVTPVKDQNGKRPDGTSDIGTTVGLCWAFSSIACLESSMLKQGITLSPIDDDANLSPWYLGSHIGYNRPCLEFNPDLIPGVEPPTTFGYYWPGKGWGGGGAFWLADHLISGKPLPLWKDAPMPTGDMTARKELTLPETGKGRQYQLREMVMFFREDFGSDLEYRDHIKRFIMEKGPVQSMIHLEPVDIDGIERQECGGAAYSGNRFINGETAGMFTFETEGLCTDLYTHGVAVVGWDDLRRISVNGRNAIGAWLVKDSMGDSSHEEGYLWVAYEDMVHLKPLVSGLVADPGCGLRHASEYQTHPGALSRIGEEENFDEREIIELGEYSYLLNGFECEDSWAVAEFPLDKEEVMRGVAFFTANRNEEVSVQIYRGTMSGVPLLALDLEIPEIGYHLVDLGHDIHFSAGDTAIVALSFRGRAGRAKLPLVYVRDVGYNPTCPTFFGTFDGDGFQLTPYSDMEGNCSFFIQAVMAGK